MLKIGNKSGSTLVIVATLNEEEGLGPTLSEINDFLADPLVLVVDGRSTDNTVEIAESRGAEVIFQKGLGKGDAIATAIEHTNGLDVKYVVFIDADFTYPAEYVAMMIEILEKNPEERSRYYKKDNEKIGKRQDVSFERGVLPKNRVLID